MSTKPSTKLKSPNPKPVLLPGVIYGSDNGRMICLQCAGFSAKFSGRDISGRKVSPTPWMETRAWLEELGKPLSCELGCLTYDPHGPTKEHLKSWAIIEAAMPPSLAECLSLLEDLSEMVDYYHDHEGCDETLKEYRAMIKRLKTAIQREAE